MSIDILADESVNFQIVKELRNHGIGVISVLEKHQGITDDQVLDIARSYNAILLTEDSDFGEWIFAHKETVRGVIFLRYLPKETGDICQVLIKVLNNPNDLPHHFIVITARKIRFRKIL